MDSIAIQFGVAPAAIVLFKANFTNTGAVTLNLNSLGAKAIKKNDGATALVANDIVSGQIVVNMSMRVSATTRLPV